jgi:hypothetical protein
MATESASLHLGVPDWPALATNQVSALPEGSRVLAMWSGDRDAQHYTVHREGGRLYARTPTDMAAGVLDRERVLTFVTRVWLPAA